MSRVTVHSRILVALVLLAALLAAVPVWAQQIQGLPQRSQKQVVTQTIGVSEVSLTYHRPLVNGREIWGSLVPHDAVWRAGANDNTTISFSDPVKIEGQDLAAGTYGLHMLPGEKEWQVIFSHNSTSWGSFSYDQEEDALRVTVRSQKAESFQEVMQYRFDHLTADGGVLVLHWEELEVPVEVEFDTNALALAHIRNSLRHLPGFSWQGFASAATYCTRNNVNQEEALEWADRALSMEENFQTLRTKAGLLEHMGKREEAVELAEKSLGYANEAQTNMLGYQFLQRGESDKAIEIFAKNTRDYPESWNVWDSLGEGQAANGMVKEAIANYEKALGMAPEAQHPRIEGVLENLKSQ